MLSSFLIGAAIGLIVGIIFSHPIWAWIKGASSKANDAIQKNAPIGTGQHPHDTL